MYPLQVQLESATELLKAAQTSKQDAELAQLALVHQLQSEITAAKALPTAAEEGLRAAKEGQKAAEEGLKAAEEGQKAAEEGQRHAEAAKEKLAQQLQAAMTAAQDAAAEASR